MEPASILQVAKQLVEANDLADRVACISGNIEEIELPEKVDVILSVLTGNFLLTEDLLPSLFYARERYLNAGGRLIPDRAVMEVVPVCVPEYYAEHIDCWSSASYGVDLDLVRSYAVNTLYYDRPKNRKALLLSDPADLFELDFMAAAEAACRSRIEVKIARNGICHGWLGWFRVRLGERWLSTSPLEKPTHWSQVFLPLAEPISVEAGDILSFELNRPEFDEWSWTVGYRGEHQRHSTFLSEPVSTALLRKKSDGCKPALSPKGQAAKDVLMQLQGKQSISTIVEQIMVEQRTPFPTRKLADRFVKDLVERYGV